LSKPVGQTADGRRAEFTGAWVGRETVLELRSPEAPQPVAPRTREGPELVQAFISRHRPFFILVGVLAAQLVLLSLQITRGQTEPLAKAWAVTAFSPFERSLRGLADVSGEAWDAVGELMQAERQNGELETRLAAEQAQVLHLTEDGLENQRLRSLLDFRPHVSSPTVAAEVIGSSLGDGSKTVVIDKGGDEGLISDAPVITPEGVAGKVIAVYPQSAQVLLLTDPAAGAGGLLESSRIQGVLKGTGGGLCRLDYVMNDNPVAVGDRVLTSGLDQVFPKGLPLGTVVKVTPGTVYKQILVKPSATLDRLEDVLVLLEKRPATDEAQVRHRN
jgi:rod shape-determining protein MreC